MDQSQQPIQHARHKWFPALVITAAAAWWLWIAVDVIYVGEYVYKALPITAVLYAGFVVLAAMGWRAWSREQAVGSAA